MAAKTELGVYFQQMVLAPVTVYVLFEGKVVPMVLPFAAVMGKVSPTEYPELSSLTVFGVPVANVLSRQGATFSVPLFSGCDAAHHLELQVPMYPRPTTEGTCPARYVGSDSTDATTGAGAPSVSSLLSHGAKPTQKVLHSNHSNKMPGSSVSDFTPVTPTAGNWSAALPIYLLSDMAKVLVAAVITTFKASVDVLNRSVAATATAAAAVVETPWNKPYARGAGQHLDFSLGSVHNITSKLHNLFGADLLEKLVTDTGGNLSRPGYGPANIEYYRHLANSVAIGWFFRLFFYKKKIIIQISCACVRA